MDYYFLFPFEKVLQSSRIVIYGAGKCGVDYYRQAVSSGYCKVVMVVDKNYNGLSVLNPEELRELDDRGYDYVVIAIHSRIASVDVTGYLISMGVSKDKIICCVNNPIPFGGSVTSGYTLAQFFEKPESIEREISFMKMFANGQTKYFSRMIQDMADFNDKIWLQKQMEQYIYKSDSTTRLVLLAVMFYSDVFTPQLMRLFVKTVADIKKDTDTKYFLTLFLSSLIFLNPQYRYEDFYADRRGICVQICDEYGFDETKLQALNKVKGYRRRICILKARFNPEPTDATTRNAVQYANELVRQGCEVFFIVVDAEFQADTSPVPNFTSSPHSSQYSEEIRKLLDEKIGVYYSSCGAGVKTRWQWALDTLVDQNPDTILDMTDEFAPMSYIYSRYFPTFNFPMREHISSMFFTGFFAFDMEACIEINKIYKSINPSQMLELPFGLDYNPPKREFVRGQYDFDNRDFLLVTVGSRLEYDLKPGFVDAVCGMLADNFRFKWILVGANAGEYIQKQYSHLINQRQIVLWGYEDDLPGLYGICDVYLNPDRTGGGTTIIWAMQQGLPVVAISESAAARHILADHTVSGGYNELIDRVIYLYEHPKELAAVKRVMLELSKDFSVKASAERIIEYMKEYCNR